MAKKVTKTSAVSTGQAATAAAPAKNKVSASRPKHLKAQAVAVAAAVEGFVESLGASLTNSEEKAAEIEQQEKPAIPMAEAAPHPINPTPAPLETSEPAPIEEASAPKTITAPIEESPTTVEVSHADISVLAYCFYLERGGENGSPADDWFRAEQALSSGRAE